MSDIKEQGFLWVLKEELLSRITMFYYKRAYRRRQIREGKRYVKGLEEQRRKGTE